MSWDSYITNVMANDFVMDCAIVGLEPPSIWASQSGGKLANLTAAEMKSLAGNQTSRQSFMAGGLTLAGVKCTVLRDQLDVDGSYCMDIRTKSSETEPDTFSICIAKSNKALVIVKAKKDVHGGKVNKVAFDMAKYLRDSSY
ncbi:profilin-1 [Engraulis encrasicolus]|uniref:profilin-1 n=1 Tax=Engraulis encrasicolus TaxID=184585 RepID=UPI002FD25F0E